MLQGMRFSFSLIVSVWIVLLACRASSLREGAFQDDEFQRMGIPMTEAEEVEEQVAYAQPSRVHDGSSSSTPESLPRRLPTPSPPFLPNPQPLWFRLPMPRPPFLLNPQALWLRLPMPNPPILPGHLPGRGLLPAPAYLLPPAPWQRPLPWHMPMVIHFLPHVFWRAPLPMPLCMPVPPHLLASVSRQEFLPHPVPMPAPEHLLANVPRRVPPPPPAHLLARVSTRVAMCKFSVDVEAAGKALQLLALFQDWEVNGSYPDLMAGVEQVLEGHPDLLETFNKFLPEEFQRIVPESVPDSVRE